jgi:hypothetical protein
MKYTRSFLGVTGLAMALFIGVFIGTVNAQPSAAQLKALEPKSPGTVSFVWHRPGKREWSSTYKKYVYSIYWTAKRKTDQPGVFLTVRGYSSFDIIGGKYVYWRDFVSENSYDGQKPPTLAEINAVMEIKGPQELKQHLQVGEYESVRLAPNPDWQWHTMNSVSFTAIAVYRVQYSGYRYGDEPYYTEPTGKTAIDRVETHLRFRLYRDSPTVPWRSVAVSDRIPAADSKYVLREVRKLLGRELIPWVQGRSLPGPTRAPVLTQ